MIAYCEDYTREEAQQKFFPDLLVSELDAYLVSYTTSADWHSEIHEDEMWLPIYPVMRRAELSKIEAKGRRAIVACEITTEMEAGREQ